jgi:hypothetical protein
LSFLAEFLARKSTSQASAVVDVSAERQTTVNAPVARFITLASCASVVLVAGALVGDASSRVRIEGRAEASLRAPSTESRTVAQTLTAAAVLSALTGVSFLTVNRRGVAKVMARAFAAVSVLAVETITGELKAIAASLQVLAVMALAVLPSY